MSYDQQWNRATHHFEVQGSCGCTVPQCEKLPIAPRKSAITVKYDTKRIGPINKSVTITSNASNEPTKVIRIKGKVEPSTSATAEAFL